MERQHKPKKCPKTRSDKFVEPCLICETYCNCDLRKCYPDIIVRTSDYDEIRLSSCVVSGSPVLQALVEPMIWDPMPTREADLFPTWAGFPRPGPGPKGADKEDLFEAPAKEAVDLRPENVNEANFATISTKLWRMFEKFMCFHLDQVDERVKARRWRLSFVEKKPEKTPGELAGGTFIFPVKYHSQFAFEPKEEAMFGNLGPAEFLAIVEMKNELQCFDLHYTLEKWIVLYGGYPKVKDFGWKVQFLDDFVFAEPLTEEGLQMRYFAQTVPTFFRDMKIKGPRRH